MVALDCLLNWQPPPSALVSARSLLGIYDLRIGLTETGMRQQKTRKNSHPLSQTWNNLEKVIQFKWLTLNYVDKSIFPTFLSV